MKTNYTELKNKISELESNVDTLSELILTMIAHTTVLSTQVVLLGKYAPEKPSSNQLRDGIEKAILQYGDKHPNIAEAVREKVVMLGYLPPGEPNLES